MGNHDGPSLQPLTFDWLISGFPMGEAGVEAYSLSNYVVDPIPEDLGITIRDHKARWIGLPESI